MLGAVHTHTHTHTPILTEKINRQYKKLHFNTQPKENLVLFVMTEIDIKYRKIKDGLYLTKYNSSLNFIYKEIKE